MRREQEEDERCSPSATTTVRGPGLGNSLTFPSTSTHKRPHVFVDVGLGFFCQTSFQEATALALKRIEHYTDEARAKKEKTRIRSGSTWKSSRGDQIVDDDGIDVIR